MHGYLVDVAQVIESRAKIKDYHYTSGRRHSFC